VTRGTRGARFSDFCNLEKMLVVCWVPLPVHAGEVPPAKLSELARILRLSGEPNVRAVLCAETDQFVERKMAKLHRSGNYQETALREGVVIGGMLNDLWRTIQILNIDISTEEERARVFDMRDPAYPILARTMAARRENLKVTVAALEHRLRTIVTTTPQMTTEAA
jgi:hypothetical protein